jgi:hypothetical protein
MGCFGGPYLIQTLMAAACQAKAASSRNQFVATGSYAVRF